MSVDVIVFALIAAIVLYRLYLTLGDRSGFDPGDVAKSSHYTAEGAPDTYADKHTEFVQPNDYDTLDSTVRPVIQEMVKIDPTFNIKDFIAGATMAYEMTLEAYTKEDTKSLKNLLSRELYQVFKSAIDARQYRHETYENTLIKLDDPVITDAKLTGTTAQLTVKFVSEQVPILKDKAGEVIEGNPDQIDQIIDYWVFERSLKSANPNWVIIETEN